MKHHGHAVQRCVKKLYNFYLILFQMVEGADNGVRFFQIRMPNGEKGWVALNSCEEDT